MSLSIASMTDRSKFYLTHRKEDSNYATTKASVRQLLVDKMRTVVNSTPLFPPEGDRKEAIRKLNKGVYYPNEYYQLLKQYQQTDRLEWLRVRGAFTFGYYPKGFAKPDLTIRPGVFPIEPKLRTTMTASEALETLVAGFSLIDCSAAVDIAILLTLKEAFGEEKFNLLFSPSGKTPFQVNNNSGVFSIASLFARRIKPGRREEIGQRGLKLGEMFGIGGDPRYVYKHRNGEAKAYNVVCSGTNPEKMLALGIGVEGVTEEKMLEILADTFNSEPLGEEMLPDHFKDPESQKYSELKYGSLKTTPDMIVKLGGGFSKETLRKLNFPLIAFLQSLSLEDTQVFWNQFVKEMRIEETVRSGQTYGRYDSPLGRSFYPVESDILDAAAKRR